MRKQLLFFRMGAYTLLLFAAAHSLSFFSDPSKLFHDEQGKQFFQLLNSYQIDVMGLTRTVAGFLRGHSLSLLVFTLVPGIQALILASVAGDQSLLLKKVSLLNTLMYALLTIIAAVYFIYPPMVLFAMITLFFLLSTIFAQKAIAEPGEAGI